MQPATKSGRGWLRGPSEVTGRMVLLCLVAFFAVVTGVNAVMIHAAISTFGGVETESSYKAGLVFAHEIAAAQAQDRRNWQVRAHVAPSRDGQRVEVVADDSAGRPLAGLVATVRLAHPTDRREDIGLDMNELSRGRFSGVARAADGQWDLVIELLRDGERVFRSRSRIVLRQG